MPVVCPGIHASARKSIRSRTALGRRLFGATLLSAASLLIVPAAQAAIAGGKPIRILVGAPAGGTTDTLARTIAQ